jgi:hypothetical protein
MTISVNYGQPIDILTFSVAGLIIDVSVHQSTLLPASRFIRVTGRAARGAFS